MRRSDLLKIEEVVRRVVREELVAASGGGTGAMIQPAAQGPAAQGKEDEDARQWADEFIAQMRARERVERPRREAAERARKEKWDQARELAQVGQIESAMNGLDAGPELLSTSDAWKLHGGGLMCASFLGSMGRAGYQPVGPRGKGKVLMWRRADVLALRRRDLLK